MNSYHSSRNTNNVYIVLSFVVSIYLSIQYIQLNQAKKIKLKHKCNFSAIELLHDPQGI